MNGILRLMCFFKNHSSSISKNWYRYSILECIQTLIILFELYIFLIFLFFNILGFHRFHLICFNLLQKDGCQLYSYRPSSNTHLRCLLAQSNRYYIQLADMINYLTIIVINQLYPSSLSHIQIFLREHMFKTFVISV